MQIHESGDSGAEVDSINDITIAKFNNKNYVFFNRFHTADVYMASLDNGRVLGSWDFKELYDKEVKKYESQVDKKMVSG